MRIFTIGLIIIFLVGMGILIRETGIQQMETRKEQYDKVVQYCLDRGYLTYTIDTKRKIHRFCLSEDGVLHVPNLTNDRYKR